MKLHNYVTTLLASIWYRFPSRKTNLILVAGSKGKDITAAFIYSILKQTGQDVGLICSTQQIINDRPLPKNLFLDTSQLNPFKLQKVLREMVYHNCKYVILAINTHTDQVRYLPSCKICVLTNFTKNQNLSSDMVNQLYLLSLPFRKASLIVLNKDDAASAYLSRLSQAQRVTYGIKNEAQIKALKIKSGEWGVFFYYTNSNSLWKNQLSIDRAIKIKQAAPKIIPLALAAIGTGAALNIPEFRIKKGLEAIDVKTVEN